MITEFVTYLQGAGLTPRVELAFTMNPVEDYSKDLPVIAVYPLSTGSSENEGGNFVLQQKTHQVACLLGCAIADWESLTNELDAAAVGWQPNASWDVMQHESSDIEGLQGGYIWWRNIYSIWSQIRKTGG